MPLVVKLSHILTAIFEKLTFQVCIKPVASDQEIARTLAIQRSYLRNTCGKLFYKGGSIEVMEGFSCSKYGQTTCRKDEHGRKKYVLFKEFVCPRCYLEGKNSGISYLEFS